MSSFELSNNLSPILVQQKQKNWEQFSKQHPDSFQALTPEQLEQFSLAIMLSDFILASALQAPELVVNLFVNKDVYQKTVPPYADLLND